jgi:ABC-type glycerol-3-phosphate transport system permease component
MPIISAIGRKCWKVRLLFLGMYVFLTLGAASMVYPFMLMLSGSTKSRVDIKFFDAIPRFLYDDTWLYRKHIEGLFNDGLTDENIAYDLDDTSFENTVPPATASPALLREWRAFLRATPLPNYAYQSGYLFSRGTIPSGLRAYKQDLAARHGKNLAQVNHALGQEFATWNSIVVRPASCLNRRSRPMDMPFYVSWNDFKARLPEECRYYASLDGYYRKLYLKPLYGISIKDYNREHGTRYDSYADIGCPRMLAANMPPREREDWIQFVRATLALQWIRVDASARSEYQQFLQAKHVTIEALNKYYGTGYRSFGEVDLIEEPPLSGTALSDWEAFIGGWKDPESKRLYQAPASALRTHSVDWLFRDYLAKNYGSIEAINRALGTSYKAVENIRLPQREYHYAWFLEHRRDLRWEFVTRNYKTVGEYVLFHGRGILNTVIYCGLAILCALLVNPLAAYALSRYKMPTTYKILLFLMATMAFPPMVTGIPNFLMLRRLGLLNTFAALILPGLANGYSIFLLKGFFDSLPRELYESASLDGASEWRIFWQLTMALSKPILAVIALGAFTGAYSNFMFAFVVCQDRSMWTLMVWLYQLQQMSSQAVMYASLIIAAIPTLIIFLFCQNLIMRGIVVPSEK